MIEVTQADREAASKILSSAITKEVIAGDFDSREIVQAFARHRVASQVEALDLLKIVLAGECVNYCYITPRHIERIKKLVGEG